MNAHSRESSPSIVTWTNLLSVPHRDVPLVRLLIRSHPGSAWMTLVLDSFWGTGDSLLIHDDDQRQMIEHLALFAPPDRAIHALTLLDRIDAVIDVGRHAPVSLAAAIERLGWDRLSPDQQRRCITILAQSPQAIYATCANIGYAYEFFLALSDRPIALLRWLFRIPEARISVPIEGWNDLCRIAAHDPWVSVAAARLGGMDMALWRGACQSCTALDAFTSIIGMHGWRAWKREYPDEAQAIQQECEGVPALAARFVSVNGPSRALEAVCRQRIEAYAIYLQRGCASGERRRQTFPSLAYSKDSSYLAAHALACPHADLSTLSAALQTPWDGFAALHTLAERRSPIPDAWMDTIARFCTQFPAILAVLPEVAIRQPQLIETLTSLPDFLSFVNRLAQQTAPPIQSPAVRQRLIEHALWFNDEEPVIAVARIIGHDPQIFAFVMQRQSCVAFERYAEAIAPFWSSIPKMQQRDILNHIDSAPNALPALANAIGYSRRLLAILDRYPAITGRYIAALGRAAWQSLPESAQRALIDICVRDALACIDACETTGHVRKFIHAVCRYPETALSYMQRVSWDSMPHTDHLALIKAVAHDPECAADAARWCGSPMVLLPSVQSSPVLLRRFLRNIADNTHVSAMTEDDWAMVRQMATISFSDHEWVSDALQCAA